MVTRLRAGQRSFIVLYADDILIFAPSLRERQTTPSSTKRATKLLFISLLKIDQVSKFFHGHTLRTVGDKTVKQIKQIKQ